MELLERKLHLLLLLRFLGTMLLCLYCACKLERYNYHFQFGLLGVVIVVLSGSCRIFWQGLGLHRTETSKIGKGLESKHLKRHLALG